MSDATLSLGLRLLKYLLVFIRKLLFKSAQAMILLKFNTLIAKWSTARFVDGTHISVNRKSALPFSLSAVVI